MKIILALIAILGCTPSSVIAAGKPTTAEERSRLLADIEKLEKDPFGPEAKMVRSQVLERIRTAPDLKITLNGALLNEVINPEKPDNELLVVQFIFGLAVPALRDPTKEPSAAESAEAGFTSLLRAYRQSLERNAANRIRFLDELDEHERKGTLKPRIATLVEQRRPPQLLK